LTNECSGATFAADRTHEAHVRAIVCVSVGARGARTGKKTIFRKTQSSRAEKGKRECARWIRARPSLHIYLRQATTPTSRRWKGVHTALEFRVLRVKRKMDWQAKGHARKHQVSPLKSCLCDGGGAVG